MRQSQEYCPANVLHFEITGICSRSIRTLSSTKRDTDVWGTNAQGSGRPIKMQNRGSMLYLWSNNYRLIILL